MLKTYLILFALFAFISCGTNAHTDYDGAYNKDIRLIVDGGLAHDFGEVLAGEVLAQRIYFTADGIGALIVKNVTSDCGCTATDWTKEPVLEGEKGYVEIQFDSHGYMGIQNKSIVLETNALNKNIEINFFVNVK
ncbi:MAG: DUF1573 domain-containing protein [Bacteroidales bacterium]|nr:DUF1573 domain-containing protein [Bacteroidales bacterium]